MSLTDYNKQNGKGMRRVLKALRCSLQGLSFAWRYESAFRQEILLVVCLFPTTFFIAQSLARELPGTALLIFNTHGESIGRGAYPGSLNDRLDYVLGAQFDATHLGPDEASLYERSLREDVSRLSALSGESGHIFLGTFTVLANSAALIAQSKLSR